MATQKEIAMDIDLSERRVRELVSQGILPTGKHRGQLDLRDCRIAYIRHLRELAAGRTRSPEDIDLARERALLAQSQRRKLDRENDIAEKLLAPTELIVRALTQCATRMHPILDSIIPRLKRENPELTAPDLMIVAEQIARAKNTIAEMELDVDDL